MTERVRKIAKYVRMTCDCDGGEGVHIIDLFAEIWTDTNTGVYTCTSCDRPLVCRDDQGRFYYVGQRVK